MAEENDEVEETFGKNLPWRTFLSFATRAVLRHPLLLFFVILSALGVVFADVLSISLILPFIDTLRGGSSGVPEGFPLGFLLPYFEGMTPQEKIEAIAIGLVLVTALRGIFTYTESRVTGYMKILVERDLREQVFDDLLRVDLRFIHKEQTANLFTILHNYPRTAAQLVDEYLGSLSKGLKFLSAAAMLFLISWELTLLGMALALTSFWAVGRFRVWIKRLGRRINRSRVRLNQTSLESLQAMKVIRLFAREDHARRRFRSEVRALQEMSFKQSSLSAAVGPVQALVNVTLLAVLLILASVVLVNSAADWVVLLTMFLFVMMRVMAPMGSLGKRQTKIAADIPAVEALIHFQERKDKTYLIDGPRPFEGLSQGITLENVSFAYADGPLVLRGVSFTIPKGKTVALVGGSGSGKSTLVSLLSRLSDPLDGRILVDGVDLREFQMATWRQRLAVVSQDTFLFNDTVRENIRYGRLDATDAEVEEAAKLALAHDFILAMDEGYETRVGDRGVRLSGGQAQRIAIARALLVNPEVLILDEATSALDAETERYVQEAIDRASHDRTVIAIAHRLSTIRQADEIIVLEKGTIVERGPHAKLMALGGVYARYVRMQDLGKDADADQAPMPPPRASRDEAARKPLRVVLAPSLQTASLYREDIAIRADLPVVVTRKGEAPWDALRDLGGSDGVILSEGSDSAKVRFDHVLHDDVPLFSAAAGQAEPKRVRVAAVRPRAGP
ncbi:MAG TPA: ABC transporter ATP-binding protein [Candidatus Thermoplasmatota archaeon]|nr:ABC transporter ATP-binding protein [Candidatus Thermoplasmatota archaeon]